MDGVILVDKSKGISSFGVVSKIKKYLKTRDVGHCGTLDPMAEGLMVICVNKALKIAKYLTEDRKTYIAKVKLGETTPTLDVEGEIVERKEVPFLSEEKIKEILLTVANSLVIIDMNRVPNSKTIEMLKNKDKETEKIFTEEPENELWKWILQYS